MIEKEDKAELYDLLDFNNTKRTMILENLINKQNLHTPIDISNDVYKDTGIDVCCRSLPILEGSKHLIQRLIRNPIKDKDLLIQRQQSIQDIGYIDFEVLKEYEDDALWIYKLTDEIKENNLINVLFPSSFILSYINYIEPVLEFYHIYKIYLIPLNVIIYPILSLFAPLYYLNRYLMFNISATTYISMLFKIVKMMFTYSGDIKTTLIKIVTISMYVFLFAYNIYQTAEYSYMLYNIKSTLYKKIFNLSTFLKEANRIISDIKAPATIIQPFLKDLDYSDTQVIEPNFPNIYKIWKDATFKDHISNALVKIYVLDVICNVSKMIRNNEWSLVKLVADDNNQETKFWNMKNPVLSAHQTANPVDLSKNIITTGPNAAGKTTYVKSILSNIILAQTFGIAYAVKAQVNMYDNIISLMRISDQLGSKSYFEAEAEYCLKMMKKAKELSQSNKRGLFLMDEPMHSTPPTEGMSTAYAVTEYIGNLPGSTVILTTHFHKLIQLENMYPHKFINISVEALPQEDGTFKFPYSIKRGYSYQCIAIELLYTKEFPIEVINSAINMKNKICAEISR
jgi:predicted ATPase